MNSFELLAMWYLRLNGYFVMPNFIAHGQPAARTDVDILGVHFPCSHEFEDDRRRLDISDDKIDVVCAEAKSGRCGLNDPWKNGEHKGAMEYVLRRVGVFNTQEDIAARPTRFEASKDMKGTGW